tara:strand:- start:5140 stop:5625 length:486 start_codon:yes stop_codon:yes gene_type:complete
MIKIRKGTKSDLGDLMQLICELAEYENAIDKVKIKIKNLEKDGFGKSPLFHFIVAEVYNQIVGMAVYYNHYSTWEGKCLFLEDLIIKKTFRSKGIGSMLFEKVIEIANKNQSNRIMWQVLHWNEPAIKFYKKYNATISKEWLNGKLSKDQIQKFNSKNSFN